MTIKIGGPNFLHEPANPEELAKLQQIANETGLLAGMNGLAEEEAKRAEQLRTEAMAQEGKQAASRKVTGGQNPLGRTQAGLPDAAIAFTMPALPMKG